MQETIEFLTVLSCPLYLGLHERFGTELSLPALMTISQAISSLGVPWGKIVGAQCPPCYVRLAGDASVVGCRIPEQWWDIVEDRRRDASVEQFIREALADMAGSEDYEPKGVIKPSRKIKFRTSKKQQPEFGLLTPTPARTRDPVVEEFFQRRLKERGPLGG